MPEEQKYSYRSGLKEKVIIVDDGIYSGQNYKKAVTVVKRVLPGMVCFCR